MGAAEGFFDGALHGQPALTRCVCYLESSEQHPGVLCALLCNNRHETRTEGCTLCFKSLLILCASDKNGTHWIKVSHRGRPHAERALRGGDHGGPLARDGAQAPAPAAPRRRGPPHPRRPPVSLGARGGRGPRPKEWSTCGCGATSLLPLFVFLCKRRARCGAAPGSALAGQRYGGPAHASLRRPGELLCLWSLEVFVEHPTGTTGAEPDAALGHPFAGPSAAVLGDSPLGRGVAAVGDTAAKGGARELASVPAPAEAPTEVPVPAGWCHACIAEPILYARVRASEAAEFAAAAAAAATTDAATSTGPDVADEANAAGLEVAVEAQADGSVGAAAQTGDDADESESSAKRARGSD